MPLNTPSNLSLGKLGHIAGGNAGHTNVTSLAATCRGSASETAMWDDFKIGTISFNEVSHLNGGDPYEYAYLILSVPSSGDVGDYMGSSSGGSDYYVSKYYDGSPSSDTLRQDDDFTIEISESGAGSLYATRIQNRSTNANDYVFSKNHISGTNNSFSPENNNSPYDRFVLVTFD
jgi:hypothetical protein